MLRKTQGGESCSVVNQLADLDPQNYESGTTFSFGSSIYDR